MNRIMVEIFILYSVGKLTLAMKDPLPNTGEEESGLAVVLLHY